MGKHTKGVGAWTCKYVSGRVRGHGGTYAHKCVGVGVPGWASVQEQVDMGRCTWGGINWGCTWACGRAQEQVDMQVHVQSSAPARGCAGVCAQGYMGACARGTRVQRYAGRHTQGTWMLSRVRTSASGRAE